MKSAVEILLGKDGWRSDGDGGAVVDTGSDTVVKLDEGGENTGIVELENPCSDWAVDEADVIRLVEAINAIREASGEPPLFVAGEKQGGEELREIEGPAPECSLYRFRDTGACALYVVAENQSAAVELAANEGWGALGEGDAVTIKNLGQPVIDMRLFGGAQKGGGE